MKAKSRRRDRSLARFIPGGLLTSAQRLLEFAAEQAIARVEKLRTSRLQALAVTALREVALRWPQLASLIETVLPGEPAAVPVEHTQAAPCSAAAPIPYPSAEKRKAYLDLLRGSPAFEERIRAARALGDVVEPEITAALARALRDASAEVAVQAAESLARHGGGVAVEALRDALRNADGFSSTATRAAAVRALGTLLPPNDGALLAATVSDADATVSLAAIAALAGRDEAVSANALLGVLEDRSAFYLPLTRHAAARALSHLHAGDPPRVRALIDSEADPEVRSALESRGA